MSTKYRSIMISINTDDRSVTVSPSTYSGDCWPNLDTTDGRNWIGLVRIMPDGSPTDDAALIRRKMLEALRQMTILIGIKSGGILEWAILFQGITVGAFLPEGRQVPNVVKELDAMIASC